MHFALGATSNTILPIRMFGFGFYSSRVEKYASVFQLYMKNLIYEVYESCATFVHSCHLRKKNAIPSFSVLIQISVMDICVTQVFQ